MAARHDPVPVLQCEFVGVVEAQDASEIAEGVYGTVVGDGIGHGGLHLLGLRHITESGEHLGAPLAHELGSSLQSFALDVYAHQSGAFFRQTERRGAPDSRRGTRYQGDPVFEALHGYGSSPCCDAGVRGGLPRSPLRVGLAVGRGPDVDL